MTGSGGDPLVTVFTPAYNHAQYLDSYFEGLLAQTYENVELILYDDGSTDATWAKVREHEPALRAKFPRVILERHENIGPEEETALGIARAGGELLCLLESDDHYLPTKLEKNVRFLERHPEAGAVHSDVDFLYGDRLERAHWQTTGRSVPSGHVLEDLLFDNFVFTCSLCCRTDLLKRHVDLRKYMSRRYSAPDYAICLELSCNAAIGYIDEPLARYRAASGSYSHPPEPERLFEFQRSIYAMKLDFVHEHDVPARAAEMVERQYYTYLYRGGFRACLTAQSEQGYAWLRAHYPSEHTGFAHTLRQRIIRRPRLCRALQRLRRFFVASAARATGRPPAVVEAARASLPPLLASASPGRGRRALLSRSRIAAGRSLPDSVETVGGSVAKRLEDLAIFGGPPAFAEPLHVGRPNLPDRAGFLQLVEEIFDGGWLTNEGPLVERFERRIAELADVEHCVATANGTLGLQLAARALGFSGEVIVPSFTFVATAHALTWLGLTPVFCDIRRETHTIDPEALERLVTPRTGGIVAVHLWGRPCEIEPLAQFARERGLPLLFDAAQAVGCSHAGRAIGGFGDAEVFSFHATKVVSAAEGGAVTTDDGELAERLRSMRNFGFSGYDTVIELGINAKMSELSAAMGLASIEDLDRIVALNRRIYLRYWRELGGVPGIRLLSYDESERHNYQYVVLQVGAEGESELRRDDLLAVLHAENVLARRYFYPGCHRLDAYAADAAGALPDLPATDEVAAHVLTLPTGTQIDEVDVETVCSIVRVAAEHPDELRQRLNAAAVA